MDYEKAVRLNEREIFEALETDPLGLKASEVIERLEKDGKNVLQRDETSVSQIFFRQLKSPFIYLLLFAALLAFLLGEFADMAMIGIFVIINTLLGFYQEYKSEQTVKLLSRHIGATVRVRRGGVEEEVESEQLAPGDVVILEAGDLIPADIRLIKVLNFSVDEAVLTGESVIVNKSTDQILKKISINEANNVVFAGTTVMEGQAQGVVYATGRKTNFGVISGLVTTTRGEGVFEKQINRFSKFILQLVAVTLVAVFLANILVKGERADNLSFVLFAVALAVSVVPEALPVVATFSFSRGAMKLALNKVVVKRLSAVEDLGSIEVLCTDKTGTLTENKMAVKEVFGDKKETLRVCAMAIPGDWALVTNPFDRAIIEGLDNKIEQGEIISVMPFDPLRKRDTVLVDDGKNQVLIARGAPETVLNLCKLKNRVEIEQWMLEEGSLGRRVWAVAKKKITKRLKPGADIEALEKEMELVGVIAFEDPIKSSAVLAIKQAQKLGVRVVVLTGDKREVAEAVALKIGLVDRGSQVMGGEVWNMLSSKQKREVVKEIRVFARVIPQQKYEIIQILQEEFQVGYLGDGINDAPALKLANVAIAVAGASDIAREASDIVLLKKDLKVLIEGIRQGREIFANTTKYIKATLSANFGNFYAVAIASLLVDYLPMLPAQILLVNLLSDFPMIAVATDTVDEDEIVSPKRFDLKEIVYLATILGIVSSIFDFVTFAIFSRYGERVLQTNWFMESILTELVFIFSIRSKQWFFMAKRPSWSLIGLSGLAAVVTLILPWSVWGMRLFHFVTPEPTAIGLVLTLVVGYFVMTEVVKKTYYQLLSGKLRGYEKPAM